MNGADFSHRETLHAGYEPGKRNVFPGGPSMMILADPGGGQVGGLFPPLQFQRGACRKISVWFPTLPSPILNSNSC